MRESSRQSGDDPSHRRQRLMVGAAGLLACLFFILDLQLPLGVANAVLYSAVVFLSAASQYRWLPIVTAITCSLLTPYSKGYCRHPQNLPAHR
ncbi:MAG: hypothetical protein E8D43_12255 [Nitrospira sp.]|nr:MAG: hypothetical protein E8D43_12255 [Nitrospira sp.]